MGDASMSQAATMLAGLSCADTSGSFCSAQPSSQRLCTWAGGRTAPATPASPPSARRPAPDSRGGGPLALAARSGLCAPLAPAPALDQQVGCTAASVAVCACSVPSEGRSAESRGPRLVADEAVGGSTPDGVQYRRRGRGLRQQLHLGAYPLLASRSSSPPANRTCSSEERPCALEDLV